MPTSHNSSHWPSLPYAEWSDTCTTLHMWTQIVGKIKLALCAPINHWWGITLHVTPLGLATGPIPYNGQLFEIEFDFIHHQLCFRTDGSHARALALKPQSVASFYREVMATLHTLDIDVTIWPVPVEVPEPIPFEDDTVHASYDAEYANRFWRILVQSHRVMTEFRSRYLGKCSPVHFFWGSFDLAVTRFTGNIAPPHPGIPGVPDYITREAYSHECSSCGVWPGGPGVASPMYYAYAYPEPDGCRDFKVQPAEAYYSNEMREFFLPYDAVRTADSPDDVLLSFLQSTYEAAAVTGGWDRKMLERA